MRFLVDFLGCKVNQYEAEALREGFERLGMRAAKSAGEAELYVLNSCSVTGHAGATTRKQMRRALRKNPQVQVLVTGCYAESDRELLEAMPGVVRVFGNGEKEAILPFVAERWLGLPAYPASLPSLSRSSQTRAFVKIEDGCDDRCSFCIIPRLRGPARSRGEDEIVAEVEGLVCAGHLEVVLTGVHLGFYGKESGDPRRALRRLLERLLAIEGLARLKLSSIEVHEIDEAFLDLVASSPRFAPHFHLPLQSGCDGTLRAMRRKYNTATFRSRVRAIRERFDRPALSTDLIVGFPGESELDFAQSLRFAEEMEFMKIHVFPYSPREGTEAAARSDAVPDRVIRERATAVGQLDEACGDRWASSFEGETIEILVEGRRDPLRGLLSGLSERYLRAVVSGPDELMGRLVSVRAGAPVAPAVVGGVLAGSGELA